MTFLKAIPAHAENVYLVVFDVAFVLALAMIPLCRRWSFRWKMLDHPGHRKIHGEPIPLLGGLGVFLAFSLTLWGGLAGLLWIGPSWGLVDFVAGARKVFWQLFGIWCGGLLIVGVGLKDDKEDMHAATKLVCQLIVALFVTASGLRIHLFVDNVVFSYAVTIVWIITVINAMNFFDNMDGLCGGVGFICAAIFGLIAAINGQFFVCVLACAFCGAVLGFLPFNYSPARIFLGDAGSHFVGYMLAVLTILATFYASNRPTALVLIIPLIVLSVPLFDMAAVSVIRAMNGQPLYKGDVNHISHRLVRAGLPKPVAVWVIWLITFALGLSALILLWANIWTSVIILTQCLAFLSAVTILEHYARKKQLTQPSPESAQKDPPVSSTKLTP